MTALLIGVACSTALTKRIGKRTVFFWSMLLTGVSCIVLLLSSRPTATVPIIGLEVLRQFAFGCSGPVLWSMMGDVADYGEWKTGRRATGTVTSAVVFALWIGLALGGAIAGWLLSFYGYQPNVAQTALRIAGHSPDRLGLVRRSIPGRRRLPALLRHQHEAEHDHLATSWPSGARAFRPRPRDAKCALTFGRIG